MTAKPAPVPLSPMPCPFVPPLVAPGVYVQIYRDSVHGPTPQGRRDALARLVERLGQLSLPGVVYHGFARELVRNWPGLVEIAVDNGLHPMASWGLDGTRDNDGTRLTAKEKGECIGEVLRDPMCVLGLADAEVAYDTDQGLDDDTDEAGALVMGEQVRKLAPSALFGDQPWFAMDSHGELRPKPRPIGRGGPFAGFPIDEFASVVNGHFIQAYCNDFTRQFGEERYDRVFNWMERDWNKIDRAFEPVGLRRFRSITIQGYGWRLRDLARCLLEWWVRRQYPVIMWSEPFPSSDTIRVVQGVQRLVVEGFACPGIDPIEAVRSWQIDANEHGANLDTDGYLGNKGLTYMGYPPIP